MEDNKSFNTNNKVFLREKWNKPLLKFLSKRVDDKLIYLGLPSPNAEDIKQWIDFIKVVIAFQCREYKKPSDPSQSRKDVEKLKTFLTTLEREDKIERHIVYDGYLEEVVLKGHDNSPRRIEFAYNDFITLYNLDFCNDIASPLEFLDNEGDIQEVFKFDAIKKLLTLQKSISQISNKFIFLLTVQCSYKGKELEHFLNDPPTQSIKDYLKKYTSLSGDEKNARIVRLFVTHLIHQNFPANNFSPKILPTIRYKGLGGVTLLHFVILGIHTDTQAGAIPVYQQFEHVINQKFVDIDTNNFSNSSNVFDEELSVKTDPVQYFSQSKTFEKLWQ